IDLYSINSDERRSYWIAELKNAEVIDEKLEKIAIKIYEEKGWLEGMRKDLRDVEADVESFNEMIEQDELFNIRFRAQDAFVFDEPVSFADDEIISNTRYVFIRRENARREIEPSEELVSGTGEKEILDGKTQKRNQKTVECSQLHNQIQNSLLVYLSKAYPKDETQLEGRTNYATSVDLYRYAADGLRYFYEVKTYPSAKACIRAALGQLLEYAFYPDCKRADHLIIVSQAPLRENDRRYIKHLQSQFPFSLGYIQFDHDNGKIIEEL
ncbi:hypothetical protein JYT60_01940, partial [bacterium AH-315-C08]|nr:hypothetical protein [bacterium AH-315-C08]